MWRVIDELLGRVDCVTGNTSLTAEHFFQFFDAKVSGVRAATATAPEPIFSVAPTSCRLEQFAEISEQEVIKAVLSLTNKQCDFDPLPTWLLKENIKYVAPFITQLFNQSLRTGQVATAFNSVYVVPRLKKPDLDPDDVKNYRPISNLPVLAKLLERMVAKQLIAYLNLHGLMPRLQSAYRSGHSTETALMKVTGDILRILDSGDLATLALLNLSAAFDTVDHDVMLRRLRVSYGLTGVSLQWFTSYQLGRTQHILYAGRSSNASPVKYGVPQGSVLEPILFILYTADLVPLIEQHGLVPHLYANDA